MPQDRWIKSSQSYANGNCVEVRATAGGHVTVRNSRFPDVQLPPFTSDEWDAFMAGVQAGEFARKDCSDR
jgi:predicted secreted Zn-dependent protease